MFILKKAIVEEILERLNQVTKVKIKIGKESRLAINYETITGEINVGDEVAVNTTANDLKLGSGGFDFIYFNKAAFKNKTIAGHIMKQRYTPWQLPVLSIEEQQSSHHALFKEKQRLNGLPVAVGALHSQLPAYCLTLKELRPKARIVYVMTDGGALSIRFSHIVRSLRSLKALDGTVTYGQAFGGDIEAVNIFSALVAVKHIMKADAAVVIMGPGITGTETELGFTGMELGQILNAVYALEGTPIAISRVSFSDKRTRHQGVSHHTLTSLNIGTQVSAEVPLPILEGAKEDKVKKQISENLLEKKHKISFHESAFSLRLLKKYMPWVTTMGRKIGEDKELFMAAGAAASKTAEYLR